VDNRLTFSFASVVAALNKCYSVPAPDQSRFLSRVVFLQRLGLFGEKYRPGKGKHLAYVYGGEPMHRLVLACELTGLASSPQLIMQIIEKRWGHISKIFKRAEAPVMLPASSNDVVLLFVGPELWFDRKPIDIRDCRLGDLAATMTSIMQSDKQPARVFAINLTSQLRRFHTALCDEWQKHEQPPIELLPAEAFAVRKPKRADDAA